MARRLRAWELITLLPFALAACVDVTPRERVPDTPAEELALQSRALQRTILEASLASAMAGTGGAYVIGGRGSVPGGFLLTIPVGFTSGTYVGHLQQRYASNEARLERLRADIDLTNAEVAATIATMETLLDEQRRELGAIRARADEGALRAQRRESTTTLGHMQRAIEGAEGRRAEFGEVRMLRLVPSETTGVDAEIAELGQRIARMREIAASLAAEL
jgi:hypothetical protein